MSRCWLGLLLACASFAAQEKPSAPAVPKQDESVPLPPDEDSVTRPEEYSFNPVKSRRDVDIGLFYFKKGDFKAAAQRFTEATKWNEGNAEAWLHLGEAEEKRGDKKAAKAAYQKYLEAAPDAKNAAEIKKHLEKLN